MAKARRSSRGRKFLYEQEVFQILQEDEHSRKSLITSFQIAEDLKLKMAKEENLVGVLGELSKFSRGVCRITVNPTDSKRSHSGSGFYIGDGWLLTTSNVVWNREQVSSASFTFVNAAQETVSYEAHERRAFVYRMVPPGRRPDYHNRDLTLLKLGIQYTAGRKRQDIATWEKDEQALLANHKPFSFQNLIKQALLPPADTKQREQDILCAVYHGNASTDGDQRRFQIGFDVTSVYQVIDFKLAEFSGGFDAAASGSPVLAFRNGQFYFLGVFLPGSYCKTEANSFAYAGQAIVWQDDLTRIISIGQKSLDKMSKIIPYSLQVSFEERAKLLMEKTVYEAAELALNNRILIL